MTNELHRLQYLDAMGLTAWVPRYHLPNARPSETASWPDVAVDTLPSKEAAPVLAPREQLQALLDTRAAALPDKSLEGAPRPEVSVGAKTPRPEQPEAPPAQVQVQGQAQAEVQPQAHWHFSMQLGCVGERWLVVVPGEQVLADRELRLLGNLFAAAGIALAHRPVLETYRWPPLQESSLQTVSENPAQDARDGLCAFLSGRERMGWKTPRQVLVFGMNKMLEALLACEDNHSATLDVPVWQGPELDALSISAEEKRALWPRLADWQAAQYE
ncbi:hypothetical protein [Halomonas halocynthiae]|uniref:hypothetical protein n=1 Tax=Halomonas halocynthiae TaxID=176290 RepID=UPI00041321FA|nr:hypothetical protein [Halomonas halocynthiae]